MPYTDKEKAKEYSRQYHLKTWSLRKIRHRDLKQLRRDKLSEWLRTYKANLSCEKCSESHPSCLDFHHINSATKEGTISNMISEGYSTKTILSEIEKCIILCKNCHAKIHYKIKNFNSPSII